MTYRLHELISRDNRTTRPTEERHPSLAEFSINEMWLNQNPRRPGPSVLDDEKRGRWNEIRFEPSVRPRTQILPNTPGPRTNPNIPTTNNNLLKEAIQHLKGIKNRLEKAMKIRRNPIILGMK